MSVLVCGPAVAALGDEAITFNRDIRPILSDTCFKCHGFDRNARQADLRLDIREDALAARGDTTPIVPGDPGRSEVVRRITTTNLDERMPPADSNRSLTPEQIELIRRWIAQGAEYQSHWSLVAPVSSPLPAVVDDLWVRNPIDRFVLARLASVGLAPSPEAGKSTLIRRATLDLTGLPPTPSEVDAFLADDSPEAYERVVERLLASPRYGERMVLEWLDAARYADSNGYQSDGTRTLWPWRDGVIRRLNENQPFDQFTVEQLAGDLLPNSTVDQRVATGFNRNHPLNGEGGRIAEESRNDYVMDRVETTSTVWLGLTLGCCRCHDHKYDPFTQRDYYRLFAYFNNVNETGAVDRGGNAAPVVQVITPERERVLAELRSGVAAAEGNLNAALVEIDAAQAEWERQPTSSVRWTMIDVSSAASKQGATLAKLDDQSLLAGGGNPDTDVYEVLARTDVAGIQGLRLEAIGDDSLPAGGPGRADNGNFVLTAIEGQAVSLTDRNMVRRLAFSTANADFAQKGWDVAGAIDTDSNTGWAVLGAANKAPRIAVFTLTEPLAWAGGAELQLRLRFESVHRQHMLGRFRLSFTTDERPTTGVVPAGVASALATPEAARNDEQKQELRGYFRRQVSPRFGELDGALAAERKRLADFEASIPQSMSMDELPQPRESFILMRGIYDKHGERVEPGVPASLPPPAPGAPSNRLGLARWLVDRANPLTARVTVNRYWQMVFGTGLVKTSEDFGTQGEPPSHPELLDWLAVRFVESGWNVKAMHRLIVTSATYRQSSFAAPELLERDPANRLLARGPRHRLSAFALRDQALAVSGLLADRFGGPPVRPYQPAGVWEDATLGKIRYEQDHGDNLYRRSLYTFWRRTVGPTMFFDVSPRNVCTVRLPRTNTPLQALIVMNDVTYVEAARVLAQRLLSETSLTPDERIARAFLLATARRPKSEEQIVLSRALDQFRRRYQADREVAQKLACAGETPRDANLDVAELAAYTAVVSLILNLDETMTKE